MTALKNFGKGVLALIAAVLLIGIVIGTITLVTMLFGFLAIAVVVVVIGYGIYCFLTELPEGPPRD